MTVRLEVRRVINASAERLFALWTQPEHLRAWWGPRGVSCPAAEVDLRAGGRFRIANRFPDGRVVWIAGAFEQIEPPRRLIYSWQLEPGPAAIERVSVRFVPQGAATEVIVLHERIADAALRDQHEQGWQGCLDGLVRYCAAA